MLFSAFFYSVLYTFVLRFFCLIKYRYRKRILLDASKYIWNIIYTHSVYDISDHIIRWKILLSPLQKFPFMKFHLNKRIWPIKNRNNSYFVLHLSKNELFINAYLRTHFQKDTDKSSTTGNQIEWYKNKCVYIYMGYKLSDESPSTCA